jgi:hypothetical protein
MGQAVQRVSRGLKVSFADTADFTTHSASHRDPPSKLRQKRAAVIQIGGNGVWRADGPVGVEERQHPGDNPCRTALLATALGLLFAARVNNAATTCLQAEV